MKLLTSLRLELVKIVRHRGTYAGPAVLAGIVCLVAYALFRRGPEHYLAHRLGREMVFGGKLLTGVALARYVMEPALIILVPLLVAAVAGGLIAGEARSGVLRTWLCRPLSRFTLFGAKQLAAWIHAVALTIFLGLFALGLGYIFFGRGDLIPLHGPLIDLPEATALKCLALGYGLAAFIMCAVASLALMASAIFENPLVASAVAVAFLLASQILGALPYFDFLRPYLLSTYLESWRGFFQPSFKPGDFVAPVSCIAAYCLVPYMVGALIFRHKDITS